LLRRITLTSSAHFASQSLSLRIREISQSVEAALNLGLTFGKNAIGVAEVTSTAMLVKALSNKKLFVQSVSDALGARNQ
jgi:hypothetical protein